MDGRNGYQISLIHAIEPLTAEQRAWRPAAGRRSIGELVRHVALGRVTWFSRMNGPGPEQALARVPQWFTDADGSRHAVEESPPTNSSDTLVEWLHLSWEPIRAIRHEWIAEDLNVTFKHRFCGKDYALSRQRVVWRIMSHDIHHGGQLAMMLAIQNMPAEQLGKLGGHIIEPPLYSSGA